MTLRAYSHTIQPRTWTGLLVWREGVSHIDQDRRRKCKFKVDCPLQKKKKKTLVSLHRDSCTSPPLTKATDGVGVVLSLKLNGGLLRVTLLVVAQPVTLDRHRLCRELPAGHNGGAVEGLELQERSWRHCGEEEPSIKSVCAHTHTHG